MSACSPTREAQSNGVGRTTMHQDDAQLHACMEKSHVEPAEWTISEKEHVFLHDAIW